MTATQVIDGVCVVHLPPRVDESCTRELVDAVRAEIDAGHQRQRNTAGRKRATIPIAPSGAGNTIVHASFDEVHWSDDGRARRLALRPKAPAG